MRDFPSEDLPEAMSSALLDAAFDGEAAGPPPGLVVYRRAATEAQASSPLTIAQRVFGLATIWSEAKRSFVYWDRTPGEAWWDDRFLEYLPRVQAAPTESSYWDALQTFTHLLGDGHTTVHRPHHLNAAPAAPPLWLTAVEGRTVVVEGEALPPGTEVLTVDGKPVDEVRRAVARSLAPSTPQATAGFSEASLLDGPAGTAADLTVRLPSGAMKECSLPRVTPRPQRPLVRVRWPSAGIVHIEFNAMTEEALEHLRARLSTFEGLRGLVLDLRWNTGGSSRVSSNLLATLLTAPARRPEMGTPVYIPWVQANAVPGRWLRFAGDPIVPDTGHPHFAGPVAVLTSACTASAAEDFLVSYLDSGRGPTIGEATAGSTGQPNWFPLPGGGVLLICTVRERFPDGTEFVGSGILPTIPCAPTVPGVQQGRDEVLDEAARFLRAISAFGRP